MVLVQRAMRGLLMVLVFALVGCDHATKVVAKIALEGTGPRTIIPGVLDLTYAENKNVAFSVLEGFTNPAKGPLILLMSSLAASAIAVAWWKRRRVAGLLEHAAFALVVGGAMGNAIDRWQRGYVVDFIHFHYWPVFNVADVAICAGGALVGIAMMRLKKEQQEGGASVPPSHRTS
jgi:signal peptidase II